MKSAFIPISLCMTTMLVAQQHTTFPNVDASFEYTQWCALPQGGGYMQTFPYSYSFQPVIEVDSLNWSTITGGDGLVAVQGDQIYYRGDYWLLQDTTMVLYDFSLNIGDTAYLDMYMEWFGHAVVVAIDTVTISGQQRLRFMLDNDDVWIQGIGSLMGFFRPIMPTPLGCSFSAYSFCGNYLDDDGVPYTMCTDFSVGVEERAPMTLTVHPNPSKGTFVLKGTQAGMPYTIHDAHGRMIMTGTFSDSTTHLQFQRSPPGLYLLRWSSGMLRLLVE